MSRASSKREPRVVGGPCVVGPSMRFLSGISYYTACLCTALAETGDCSAILMRRLLPKRLYPGHARVGKSLSGLRIPADVHVFDGVDWFWLPSLFRSIWFLVRRRPRHVLFQWWTGAVLHSYLVLALVARLVGANVVVELHEVQDVGEAERRWVRGYVGLIAPLFFALARRFVVHSEHDRSGVAARYGLDPDDVVVIPHATYSNYGEVAPRSTPHSACNLLNFGIIRPFKGVEVLIEAFDSLPPETAREYQLTVVGETWEGWTQPGEMIEASRYRDRITFVNRYVSDGEVAQAFSAADVVVLPYLRSSQSGPLHVAMHYGLPVVVTAVGGLVEAVRDYEGAILVEPGNPDALAEGIQRARRLSGRRFHNPCDWATTAERYRMLFRDLDADRAPDIAGAVTAETGDA
jgi:glycosyltransferase involved in cell wall biosynthesis